MAMEKTGDIARGRTPPEKPLTDKQASQQTLKQLEQDPRARLAEVAKQGANRVRAN